MATSPTLVNTPNQLDGVAGAGSYYTFAQTGTRNTGVNISVATGTTYSAPQAMLIVVNTNPAGGPLVYMDFFELCYDAVNTAGVAGFFYHRIDQGNLYSAGTAMTGYNAFGAQPPGVLVYSGVVTAGTATANTRDLYKQVYMNGVGAATPTMNITVKYGAQELGQASSAIPATTAQEVRLAAPPVIVAPGFSYILNEFQTSRSATGTGEFFVGLSVI